MNDRALTIHQPWADLIIAGAKDVENRRWALPSTVSTPLRLWIHAAKKPDPRMREILEAEYGADVYLSARTLPGDNPAHYGALLGSVTVTGCHHADDCKRAVPDWSRYEDRGHVVGVGIKDGFCSRWAEPNCWHWELSDPKPLPEPIPMRGRQRLWKIDSSTLTLLTGASRCPR